MMKKILISVGIVVVVSGLTIGSLYFTKNSKSTPATKTPVSKTLVLDHSKDYGACELLSVSSIKTTLGDTAKNLQPLVNAGITKDQYFGEGVKDLVSDTQTCVYPFAAGSKSDTTLSAANGFIVKLTKYTNTDGPKALIEQMKQNPTATSIASLGDAAFYITDGSSKGPDATDSFELLVFKNNDSTSYSIIQPVKNVTLTADSAKTALLALAKSVG